MDSHLQIHIDRLAKQPLSEQIRLSVIKAIESGLLAPGTRLLSWQDLAAQLGVSRGTVKEAYERLSDTQTVETFGAGGTRVASQRSAGRAQPEAPPLSAFMRTHLQMNAGPAIFQLGTPALSLPEKLFYACSLLQSIEAEVSVVAGLF